MIKDWVGLCVQSPNVDKKKESFLPIDSNNSNCNVFLFMSEIIRIIFFFDML